MLNKNLIPVEVGIVQSAQRIDSDFWDDVVRAVRSEYLSDVQAYPWIIGFSGGKDSTVVAQAVFEALLEIPPSQRQRHVHLVSN
ncbi:MAG: hypothetical protein Q8K35_07360, partial [Thiobacillus sp.]|nr:hypothetical protein [Thiobacillus sp.]